MPRWALVVAAAVAAVLVASQVVIPPLAEREVEARLTANGGEAAVTLGAIPALRLLLGDGERLEIDARGLELDLERRTQVFDRLDGFAIVDISIEDFSAGPFEVATFELQRDEADTYRLVSRGATSPSELAEFGVESFELPGASVADFLLDRLFGAREPRIPFDLDMELRSDDGRVVVVAGGGTVAGVPAGPVAQLITSAIVVRL